MFWLTSKCIDILCTKCDLMCTVTIIHLLWCHACHIYFIGHPVHWILRDLDHTPESCLHDYSSTESLRSVTVCEDSLPRQDVYSVYCHCFVYAKTLNINAKIRTGCLFILIRDFWITPHWEETCWRQMSPFKSLHLTLKDGHKFCCHHLRVRLLGWWREYLLNGGLF